MRRLIIVFGQSVDTFQPGILVVVCSLVLCGVVSECPPDVQIQADSCFSEYSTQFQSMKTSQRKMCCGVDVETLRAFCSAYNKGMGCYNQLKSQCPADRFQPSERIIMNFKGSEEGLHELCSNDNIYEQYARHQNCFTNQGHFSEQCLSKYMNNSVRLMSTVNRSSKDELCRDMQRALNCIKPNIQAVCGVEAAKLVEILVKPMVRGTGECNYINFSIESTEKPQQHQPSRTPSARDDRNKYITDNGNGARALMTSQWLQAAYFVLLCVIIINGRH